MFSHVLRTRARCIKPTAHLGQRSSTRAAKGEFFWLAAAIVQKNHCSVLLSQIEEVFANTLRGIYSRRYNVTRAFRRRPAYGLSEITKRRGKSRAFVIPIRGVTETVNFSSASASRTVSEPRVRSAP